LPPTSFRPNVTIGTLSLAVCLPLLGRTRDLHPLDYAHVGRTTKRGCAIDGHSLLKNLVRKSGLLQCACVGSLNHCFAGIEVNLHATIQCTAGLGVVGSDGAVLAKTLASLDLLCAYAK